MRKLRMFGCLAVLLISSLCLARDVAVITNAGNVSAGVSSADLQKLLKIDTPKWPDGKKVTIFLTDPDSAEGKLVLQRVYRMTPGEIKTFIDGHKGSIVVLASDDMVLKAVAENPGALGIVNVYSITSSVKVLKVDGKLPLEQGYLLHGN